MAERFEKKYSLPNALYADDAPLIISTGALLMDSLSKKNLVQLKFKNISDKEISTVRVSVSALNESGEVLGNAAEYSYTGLAAEREAEFGQKAGIAMPSAEAVSFSASVLRVDFSDGSAWDGTGSVWSALKSPRTLSEALGEEELAHQYAIRNGSDCTTMPEGDRGLWYCVCGAVNHDSEAKCYRCRRIYSAMKDINIPLLRSESAQRLESEKKQDDEEQTKRKAGRKKLLIALAIAIPVIIAIIIVLCTVPRNIREKEDYAAAQELLDAGKYDEAQAAFAAMGDYSDAREQAEKCVPYAKATYVMECAKNDDVSGLLLLGMKRSDVADGETVSVTLYREAAKLFEALGDYKDSAEQVAAANAAVDEYFVSQTKAEYDSAKALLDEGSYCAARDAFLAMDGYSNSAEMATECMYQRASRLYTLINGYYMEGISANISDVAGQKSVFYIPQSVYASLGSGLSSDIRDIFSGDGVEINIEDPPEEGVALICDEVSREFDELGDYKDSKEMSEKSLEAGNFTKKFYQMCSDGDIVGAYQWLTEFTGEFENRDAWLAALTKYAAYCGTWTFYQGDSTLIAQTVGQNVQCGSFTAKVVINDFVANLIITPDGSDGSTLIFDTVTDDNGLRGFNNSPDGVSVYYITISNSGRLTYTRYNSLGLQVGIQSCEYSKAE